MAMYEDLQTCFDEWLGNGKNIITCIDANEDIQHGVTKEFFDKNNMQEVILHWHHGKSSPATCNKNTRRVSIDGIFCTPGLEVIAAGYRPFEEYVASDHRVLWVDFTKQSVLGQDFTPNDSTPGPSTEDTTPKSVKKIQWFRV